MENYVEKLLEPPIFWVFLLTEVMILIKFAKLKKVEEKDKIIIKVSIQTTFQ
jgi:hypothetical protein